MSSKIKGVGIPGKLRAAGTIYEDSRSGILYVQNQSPFGSNWTPLDANYLDDSLGGSGSMFTGGTVIGATNFLSTISSGGTNLNSIFAQLNHTHTISDVTNLQDTLNSKAPLDSPYFVGKMNLGSEEESGEFKILGNLTATTIYATNQMITNGFCVNVTNLTEGANYDILDTDYVLFIQASLTVFLPASPIEGRILIFKMFSTPGRTLTIDGKGKTIDGSSSTSLSTARSTMTMIYNSTTADWMIV